MRKKFLITGSILFILGLGYSFVWYRASQILKEELLLLFEDLKQHQGDIKYDKLTVTGYPFKLQARLKNPYVIKDKAGLSFIKIEGDLLAQSSLFNRDRLIFSSQGTTCITYVPTPDHQAISLTSQKVEGELSLSGKHFNRSVILKVKEVDAHIFSNQLKIDDITIQNFETQWPTHLKTRIEARNISHPFKIYTPFDQKIDHLGLTVRFDLEDPAAINRFSDLFEALSKKGGTLELEESNLQWGLLKINGNGTISLDTLHQPVASFSLTVQGLKTILEQMVAFKMIQSYVPSVAEMLLSPFKIASKDPDSLPIYQISLTLQDGQVSLNTIPLIKIPSIQWTAEEFVQDSSEKAQSPALP